jgi:hypothetical protein
MANVNRSWRVLPHLPIEELSENLWRVQGSLEGMALKRVMTIARRQDGDLVIHNGIALEEADMKRIEQLGRVAYVIVPNGYHRLDAPAFQARYPEAKLLCPKGATAKVKQVARVDGSYQDFPSDPLVSFEEVDGVGDAEGVMAVRSQDGLTLVFNDLLFNMPHGRGLSGMIFKHVTQSTGGPRVSRVLRWFVVKDRAAVRASFERLAALPELKRIIVSHHRMIRDDPAGTLRAVAATL